MQQWDFLNKGFDYWVISIIGCQSSGKSTFLNKVFGTCFEVMNSTVRKQTTKGIWTGRTGTEEKPILVFDVEGTDSRERRNENGMFERRSSLFSLALSEVLIINLWCNDIGRDVGAYFNLFTIVFELNLQLFAKASGNTNKTLLIFLLRDYYGETPVEALMHTIYDDMDQVWSRINKPEEFKTKKISDIFDFTHYSLPRNTHPDFENKILELREKFLNPKHPECPLQAKYKKGVPSDGFPLHASNIWHTIEENKDLDLPSQKHLLSMYRCDEIMKVALDTFNNELVPIKDFIVKGGIYKTFGTDCTNIVNRVIEAFDTEAKRYEKQVYDEYRLKFIEKLNSELYPSFETQVKFIMAELKQTFNERIKDLVGQGKTLIENFNLKSREIIKLIFNEFETMIMNCLVPNFAWSYYMVKIEFEKAVNEKMEAIRSNQLELFYNNTLENLEQQFVKNLSQTFENSEDDLWDSIREYFEVTRQKREEDYRAKLEELFGYERFEHKNIDDISKEALLLTFKHKTNSLDVIMDRKFSKLFKLDENGVPKRWKREIILKICGLRLNLELRKLLISIPY